jgi:hypothetical protein
VDWRSFSRALLAAALLVGLSACGRQAVRATEKEFLADRIMVFDSNGQEVAAEEHVLTNREGSAGGRGTGGGGCGCN